VVDGLTMEVKSQWTTLGLKQFGPLQKYKDKKRLTSQLRLNFSEEQPGTPFVTTKGKEEFCVN
jgi:hypothetical protein